MPRIQLIIGLGNPGSEYTATRHNAGAWFINLLADDAHVSLKPESKLKSTLVKVPGTPAHFLAIPSVYMNQSGEAVNAILNYYKISPEECLVVHDEIDLPPGSIKLKENGGHGGHNGLRDIFQKIGTQKFWRLRIGVGHPGHKSQVVSYVLKAPSKEDKTHIDDAITRASHVVPFLLEGDMQKAMMALHTE